MSLPCFFLHTLKVFLHLPYELFEGSALEVLTRLPLPPVLALILIYIAIELIIVTLRISVRCLSVSLLTELLLLLMPMVLVVFEGFEVLVGLLLLTSVIWTLARLPLMSCLSSEATEGVGIATSRWSVHVILLPLGFVAQNRVSVWYLFEFSFVATFLVWVILLGQLVICNFEVLLGGVVWDAQWLVIVLPWVPVPVAELREHASLVLTYNAGQINWRLHCHHCKELPLENRLFEMANFGESSDYCDLVMAAKQVGRNHHHVASFMVSKIQLK